MKQGDPLSPKLFEVVLDDTLQRLRQRWTGEHFGVEIKGVKITDAEFADDTNLYISFKPMGEFSAKMNKILPCMQDICLHDEKLSKNKCI